MEAIFLDDDVHEPWQGYIALNAELAATFPEITIRHSPLPNCGT